MAPIAARTSDLRMLDLGPVGVMSETERLWVWRRTCTEGNRVADEGSEELEYFRMERDAICLLVVLIGGLWTDL